jgi:membrane fusion protein (multidrug efflux system)
MFPIPSQPRLRIRPLRAAVFVVALVLAAGAAWWLIDRAGVIVTSDARVRARMVTISSEIAGQIAQLPLQAGDRVKPGLPVARLDDREAKLALAAAALELKALEAKIAGEKLRAELARARGASRVSAQQSGLSVANAETATARTLLAAAEADHARAVKLHAGGLVTQAAMDRADAALQSAQQAVLKAEAAAGVGKANIDEAKAEAGEADMLAQTIEALSLQAHALRQRIALLKVELEHHTVESPLDGVIDDVFAEAGEYVGPGARIALAHSPDDLWVEANIKETELAGVRIGASVEIQLDAGRESCRGEVERIGEAAISEFALIPNANPTGVFTKITQRVPVRIAFGADCIGARPGAMATLKIRTQ